MVGPSRWHQAMTFPTVAAAIRLGEGVASADVAGSRAALPLAAVVTQAGDALEEPVEPPLQLGEERVDRWQVSAAAVDRERGGLGGWVSVISHWRACAA